MPPVKRRLGGLAALARLPDPGQLREVEVFGRIYIRLSRGWQSCHGQGQHSELYRDVAFHDVLLLVRNPEVIFSAFREEIGRSRS
jgi:hypothetical protein